MAATMPHHRDARYYSTSTRCYSTLPYLISPTPTPPSSNSFLPYPSLSSTPPPGRQDGANIAFAESSGLTNKNWKNNYEFTGVHYIRQKYWKAAFALEESPSVSYWLYTWCHLFNGINIDQTPFWSTRPLDLIRPAETYPPLLTDYKTAGGHEMKSGMH